MKQKAKKCGYCGADLQAKTTRKKFCSSKCRVYASRQVGQPIAIAPGIKGITENPTSQATSTPPELKGIDLAIWRAEQKSKA